MKSQNRQLGYLGERLAANYLVDKGYKILKQNFSNRFGEIDIIAQDKDTTVFVEVKTKKGEEFGTPEEMINNHKLRQVERMAYVYLNGQDSVRCRIDVVAIVLSVNGQILRINHYECVSPSS